jgi:hypothetical protein
LPHERIPDYERRAKIFVCSSRAESMHISSAEALCSGCSVVGAAEIASMHEYASMASGTMAWTRRTSDFVDAVGAEIFAWKQGLRNPTNISMNFRKSLDSQNIADSMCRLIEQTAT